LPRFRRRGAYLVEVDDGLARPSVAYCLPHAGAGVTWTGALARALSASWGVCGVLLPGREARFAEPLATSVAEVAAAVAGEIESVHPPGRRALLYGQSLGGVVGFEVARLLEARDAVAPAALVVLGAPAPSRPGPPDEALGDEELLRLLGELGLGEAAAVDDPSLRERALHVLRRDMCLYERYEWGGSGKVQAPIVSVRGRSDPFVDRAAAAAWREATEGRFRLVEVAGRHLPLLDASASWTRALVEIWHDDG
jgi:surfactin synthase thioesterase subunit